MFRSCLEHDSFKATHSSKVRNFNPLLYHIRRLLPIVLLLALIRVHLLAEVSISERHWHLVQIVFLLWRQFIQRRFTLFNLLSQFDDSFFHVEALLDLLKSLFGHCVRDNIELVMWIVSLHLHLIWRGNLGWRSHIWRILKVFTLILDSLWGRIFNFTLSMVNWNWKIAERYFILRLSHPEIPFQINFYLWTERLERLLRHMTFQERLFGRCLIMSHEFWRTELVFADILRFSLLH